MKKLIKKIRKLDLSELGISGSLDLGFLSPASFFYMMV